MDYLSYLPPSANVDAIVKEQSKRLTWVKQDKKGFLRYRTPALQLREYRATRVDCSGDTVIIGDSQEINDTDRRIIWLREAMNVLSERELRIVRERRLADESATLEALGVRLGISKERVRQIETRAIEKLRRALMERHPHDVAGAMI